MEKKLNSEAVKKINYVDLMALINETNRPPGGLKSILKITSLCNVAQNDCVLDIGCNTGFVSFQLANIRKCSVIGVDINSNMIQSANNKLLNFHSKEKVKFHVADAAKLPFEDKYFDLSICGGSLAFFPNKKASLNEMRRVVKKEKFISSIDFYYKKQPAQELLTKLKETLGFEVPLWDENYWYNLFKTPGLDLVLFEKEDESFVSDEKIKAYVDAIVERSQTLFTEDGIIEVKKRLLQIFSIFNENNKHLGVLKIIAQVVSEKSEPILFV